MFNAAESSEHPDVPEPEVQRLSPTEDLLMGLLGAYWRLGLTSMVQIPNIHRKALDRLADLGLLHHDHGNIDKHRKVSLTEAGLVYQINPAFVPPAFRPECPSFYLGPKTAEIRVDCSRSHHHKGKHRARWYKRKPTKKGAVTVVETEVKWTDEQAEGLDSERDGEELRGYIAQRAERIAQARARFGKPVPDPKDDPLL